MKQLDAKALADGRSTASGPFLILFCLWACLGAGCTSLPTDFETPSVNVTSFTPMSSEGFTPRFEIGMRVVNPNATRLNLRGMSYKIFLNEYEVAQGAAHELPAVPAYGEAEFKVMAVVGLLESMRFVNDLLRNTGQVAYRLETKLDTGTATAPIRIEKTGSFSP